MNASFAIWNCRRIEAVAIGFMLVGGHDFALTFLAPGAA